MVRPTDSFALLHYNMVHAHNTFKFGYDIILKHLENPPMDDLKNFLGYCEAWAASIDGHHDSEEDIVFPFLNKKMDFSGEADAHKVIHTGVNEILTIVRDAREDPSKFDATALKVKLIELKTPLYDHLDEEVEHVSAENVKSAGFTEAEVKAMIAQLESHAKSHGDPFLLVPYMISHTPPDLKAEWPGMPWVLRKVVVPYVLAAKHRGYWKYSRYAMS